MDALRLAAPPVLPHRRKQAIHAPARPTPRRQPRSCRPSGHDITAKLARLDAEQAHRRAEISTVRELIAKLEATLPIARAREADFKSLTEQGFMSRPCRARTGRASASSRSATSPPSVPA